MTLRSTLLLALLLLAGAARAQLFPVDTLLKTGPVANRVNLVFVGDGYQAAEMGQYLADVNAAVTELFNESPFREYRAYFNVFAIRVPSAQSGTSHPRTAADCGSSSMPVSAPSTYFNTAFDNNNLHRAVVTRGQAALGRVLGTSFPRYSRAVVLVNTREYGGTGGNAITMSANAASPQILLHELGHTFAGVADEYWPGLSYAAERANLTQNTAPPRWQAWVGTVGTGTYPHQEAPTWFRPHQNCKMRVLNAPFCPVCTEAIVEAIHTASRPFDSFSPRAATLPNPTQDQTFAVTVLTPTPNTMRVKWRLDGQPLAGNGLQVTVPLARLAAGNHTVEAEVLDTTALTRSVAHRSQHRYVNYWDIVAAPTGTTLTTGTADYTLEAYPNPTPDAFTLAYTLPRPGTVRLSVLDAAGRRLRTLAHGRQPAGRYTYDLRAAELGLRAAGIYTLLLDVDGQVLRQRLVRE